MAAGIVRFVSKRQASERTASAVAADQLALLPLDVLNNLPGDARLAISRATLALQRHARPEESIWPGGFVMLSREETALVWDAIRALPPSERPNHVRHAFDLVLLNLRRDTGEVALTRDEFADRIGCSSKHVSSIMSTLERMGVIRREIRRVPGMRGPGMVAYLVNPHIGWNGSLDVRKSEAVKVKQPALRLVEAEAP